MNNHFFNTVNLQDADLLLKIDQAKAQEEAILQIFKRFSEYSFRTYDIEQLLQTHHIPFNHDSVKRSITVLQKAGKLIRSDKACVPGPFRLAVNVWQYNRGSL